MDTQAGRSMDGESSEIAALLPYAAA